MFAALDSLHIEVRIPHGPPLVADTITHRGEDMSLGDAAEIGLLGWVQCAVMSSATALASVSAVARAWDFCSHGTRPH
ncbi:hypothetical protein K3F48_19690 [Methylosinus sp. Sm6]|nr:hypothetical protein [Methylosinus sp. Sm6]